MKLLLARCFVFETLLAGFAQIELRILPNFPAAPFPQGWLSTGRGAWVGMQNGDHSYKAGGRLDDQVDQRPGASPCHVLISEQTGLVGRDGSLKSGLHAPEILDFSTAHELLMSPHSARGDIHVRRYS